MQHLSAEAQKTLSVIGQGDHPSDASVLTKLVWEVRGLSHRLDSLDREITKKIEDVAAATHPATADIGAQMGQIGEQLNALRASESVNKKLFDTLHSELLDYRDNFLRESLQKPFIHDLVLLFDDLSILAQQLRGASEEKRQRGNIIRWRENLENTLHSLLEILHRFGVKEVEPKETVDRTIHRVVSFEPAAYPEEDGRIVMRLRRGFMWRDKLIRPEEVIAKRYG
jgi:molecular chaperone GrpE (heat shock protein)